MSVETLEPVRKRLKTANNVEAKINEYIETMVSSTANLRPVINEDFYEPIPLIKAYIGVIKSPKDISKTILTLNRKVPIKELQHLKRVQKKQVVICPTVYLKELTIEEFIAKNTEELKEVFEELKEYAVPSLPPRIRKQFDGANKIWPCNFHPNKYNEKLVSGNFFSEEELKNHRQFMEVAFETAKFYIKHLRNINEYSENILEKVNCAVVVDPTLKSIVAISFDNRIKHPIQHSAMLAIDNVAKTQNGGAWVTDKEELEIIDRPLRGIEKDLCCHLKQRFSMIKFGAKSFKSKKDMTEQELVENSNCGPYLCTGYYIYMIREPCLMCSMALVHARMKRVFFCFDNSEMGALNSKAKLQTVASLNHHFEVFSGFL